MGAQIFRKLDLNFRIRARIGGRLMVTTEILNDPHPELAEGRGAAQCRRMQIYVYMLRCSDGSYYVGLTRAGLEQRLFEHASGTFEGYTSKRRPVTLVWSQHFFSLNDAIAGERHLKGWRRVKKEALIRGDYGALSALSRTARPHPSASSG